MPDSSARTALVTGGAAGIGRAVAERLRASGFDVLVADVDAETGRSACERMGASFVEADVATEAGIRTMVSAALDGFGRLDVLVHNAGGAPAPYYPDAPYEHWSRTVDLNLRAPMLASQLALPLMVRRGGTIVQVASVAGLGAAPTDAPEYAAAKAGLVRLTTALGSWRERFGIRVHCVCPDWVDTPASRREREGMTEVARAALPPILDPTEVADAVADLIEEREANGRVVLLRGGRPPKFVPALDWREL